MAVSISLKPAAEKYSRASRVAPSSRGVGIDIVPKTVATLAEVTVRPARARKQASEQKKGGRHRQTDRETAGVFFSWSQIRQLRVQYKYLDY